MIKQLLSYSFIMIINVGLLWSNTFVNEALTLMVVVCTVSTVPAVFLSYLLLYVHYHHLDLVLSAGLHQVFLSQPEDPEDLLDIRAEHEFVSDVENYNEEYPQQILDDNSENSEAESAKMVLHHGNGEKPSTTWRNSLRKIMLKKQRGSWEDLKVRGQWITMND